MKGGYWALFFFAPVYLVGSAVYRSDPNDLDVVVVLEADLYWACYPTRLHWERDWAKQSRELTLLVGFRVDFKVQFREDFWKQSGPRQLLLHPQHG